MDTQHTPTAPADTSVMAALLAQEETAVHIPKVGELVTGKVLSVSKNEVHLDIEGLTTGVVRGRELFDESGETADLKIGDTVTATVSELENEHGQMELSFRTAGHRKAWDYLLQLQADGTVCDVTIVEANRGGLMVRLKRINGFLPVSQLSTEHYPRVDGGDKQRIQELLGQYQGHIFKVKVLDVNEKDEKLIVSEKAAREEAQRERLAAYQVGQVVHGKVSGVVDFGAFMEFDTGLEGLIHISELAWQRIDHPRDLVKVGQELDAKVINIEGTKVSLSVKQMTDDPWKSAVEKYHVGQIVRGTVARTNTFGAFVELDPDIQGLCHISELSHKMVRHPHDVVKEGETYTFQILSIDADEHRLGLSKKALEEPPEPAPKNEPASAESTPVPVAETAAPSDTGETTVSPAPAPDAVSTAEETPAQ